MNSPLNCPPLSEHEIHFKIKSNTDYKSAFDFLHFLFDINGMRYEAEAGIISAYPWTEKDGCDDISSLESARYSPAESFIKPISQRSKGACNRGSPAMPMTAAITCQGTKTAELWFNGEKILEYKCRGICPRTAQRAIRTGESKALLEQNHPASRGRKRRRDIFCNR